MIEPVFEAYTAELRKLLTLGTRRCLDSAERPALLFSGGLDSCILAALLTVLHPEPAPLIVAGSNAASDIQAARQAAIALGLPLEIRRFTADEVVEALPSILVASGTTDVLQVSLAIPLHFAASRAHELAVTVLLSGQGADELFGGYARYERLVQEDKTEAAKAAMRMDYEKLLEVTLPCQEAVVGRHSIQLAAPYLNKSVVSFAQKLPLHYKLLQTESGIVRKRILRDLAVDLELPAAIAGTPKRAAQYGSGAARLLAELSAGFWRQRTPQLSLREARTRARVRQFLDRVKEQELTMKRTTQI